MKYENRNVVIEILDEISEINKSLDHLLSDDCETVTLDIMSKSAFTNDYHHTYFRIQSGFKDCVIKYFKNRLKDLMNELDGL
jgi:hypothetical protein